MEEDNKNSFKVCRVCLGCYPSDDCLSLFHVENGRAISDLIISIAKVEIVKGDSLPDCICNECFHELEKAVKFKQKCEHSYFTLINDTFKNPLIPKVDIKEELSFDNNCEFDTSFHENSVETEFEIEDKNIKKSRANDLSLECHDCGELFKSKCKLRVHWKRAHQSSYLKCERCKRQFKSFKAYNLHKKISPASCTVAKFIRIEGEGKNRMFYCKDCDYKSIRVKDMMNHYLCHSGERPFTCSICLKTFTQHSSLSSHQENVHKLYKVEGTCHVCGKYLKGRNKFYKHLKGHSEKNQQCVICNKIFKTKKTLKVHMQRHADIKTLSCEICGSRYYTISDLCNHKRNVHFKDSKVYKCDLCEYVANKNETIKKHRAKHTGANIPCLVCGVFLENEETYLLHQKRHTDKQFQCTLCEKSFYRKRYLNDHMRKKHGHGESGPKALTKKIQVKKESSVIIQYEDINSLSPTVID
ncbi:zinc finger protein 62 homolog [Bombyx mori]|uniref:Uncharacterized protein n=1 Tax=Bombyx mori TaxID=7091 RepID=A0A8R2QXX2_BOMMO|nr:zinc finger protein 62 homolog [Bombyx mori]